MRGLAFLRWGSRGRPVLPIRPGMGMLHRFTQAYPILYLEFARTFPFRVPRRSDSRPETRASRTPRAEPRRGGYGGAGMVPYNFPMHPRDPFFRPGGRAPA